MRGNPLNPMMNNFTPRAQQVLALARKEADRFNHNYVGTEHLLLGLIKLGKHDKAAEVTGRFEPDAHLKVGQNLPLALDLNHFHLFDCKTGLAIRGNGW